MVLHPQAGPVEPGQEYRAVDHRLALDPTWNAVLAALGIGRISYADLRDAQRAFRLR